MATDRFARHHALAGFGPQAQERLRRARVLVVGLGGLGSPVARYLAAAGVGHMGLVDFGRVDAPDLQRQILYGDQDVGASKAATAAAHVRQAHGDVDVAALDRPFASTMVTGYDVVVDGTDEPGTRALVHKACVQARVPLVWGALEAWDAQITTVVPGGACLDCLFPDGREAPSCSEVGVFGPLAGTVGSIMAGEAVKVLTGHATLAGRLLVVDAAQGTFETVAFHRRPDCGTCAGVAK